MEVFPLMEREIENEFKAGFVTSKVITLGEFSTHILPIFNIDFILLRKVLAINFLIKQLNLIQKPEVLMFYQIFE